MELLIRARTTAQHASQKAHEARIEAELANAAKDKFLAMVSHELRVPLQAILAGVQVLRNKSHLPSELEPIVNVIERNARIETKLVRDLNDLSRSSAGKMTLDCEPVVLRRIIVMLGLASDWLSSKAWSNCMEAQFRRTAKEQEKAAHSSSDCRFRAGDQRQGLLNPNALLIKRPNRFPLKSESEFKQDVVPVVRRLDFRNIRGWFSAYGRRYILQRGSNVIISILARENDGFLQRNRTGADVTGQLS